MLNWFSDQRSQLTFDHTPRQAEEYEGGSMEEALAQMSLLSRMSGGQAEDFKMLERGYEEVLDANSRVYAEYLKEVLESADGIHEAPGPPELILTRGGGEGDDSEEREEEEEVEGEEEDEMGTMGLENRRYNPMWVGADQSSGISKRHSSKGQHKSLKKAPTLYPQRVSHDDLFRRPIKENPKFTSTLTHVSGPSLSNDDNSEDSYSYSGFNPDKEDNNKIDKALLESDQNQNQSYSDPAMVDSDSILPTEKQIPPKDFVCPITSQLFDDPVTLETGQTYERTAIQEWLDRGNVTCPITRQKLQNIQLPKTNYVLKRLIASWKENNIHSTPMTPENQPLKTADDLIRSLSPTCVIFQASTDGAPGDLRLAISRLCTSEVLGESEIAVFQIEKFWRETGTEPGILTALSRPAVINGFVEILFNSVDPQVLGATVFLLSELASKDKFVVQTLTRVDSDVECMVVLFTKGLVEAVVLIYLLSPPLDILTEMEMVDALMMTVKRREEDVYEMCLTPRTASILLLDRILRGEHYHNVSEIAGALVAERVVESLIPSLEADLVEERIATVGILLRCMEEDGSCRDVVADKAELAPILESFTAVRDVERFEIVQFFSELVKLNRRTFNEQLLHIIKDEGTFSTMHILLVYLQTALEDELPTIAGLLLQLDLLVEPRRMSMYREEAIDALISCLKNQDFSSSQLSAAETISALQGRFSSSGKPLARVFLLKRAGMSKSYRQLMRDESMNYSLGDSEENLEEEKAADEWERKMAFALVSHEFGLVFEALADGLKSRKPKLHAACLVSASWLVHMLSILPDTGVRGAARVCLLKEFVSILKSAKDVNDKALAMLALRSFMLDPEGLHEIALHVKDVLKTLRELKKSSMLAYEMLKVLTDGQESSIHDMWDHKELIQVDCSEHGEVLAIVYFKDRIFSGHLDGTIKVWGGGEDLLQLIQETREHSKAVTSLAISQSGDKLYSGSLDKSVRIWSVRDGEIQCIEVHDMKDQVHNLAVANAIACFVPQGTGVKVLSWNGGSKLLNPNKHVRCVTLVQGKLYCGCHDSSIQEIDLATGTLGTIQSGNRKLLSKSNPIFAVQVHDGLLYSAGTSLDGAAVKIWNATNYSPVGSLPSTMEVRSIAISTELIYLGCKMGVVEIWSREKLTRVGTLQTATSGKVQTMAVDDDAGTLVIGTSDGRIQAWGLT